ncbi:MAG: nucleotidyltransferase domain-containing protein [Taibaiella sp.]|nr:nucleotidyltransferase domain-containing protein [Taibaiella sp.]
MLKNVNITHNTRLSVLYALQYYSIFDYPLKAEEIFQNAPHHCTLSDIIIAIDELETENKIFAYEGYYTLTPDVAALVYRRKKGNALARIQEVSAYKTGSFIYKFPFVRFVGISGSLSKGYADEHSDFDFFIITDKNRLWICRTLLHLYKKLTFITGRQHMYCMNYFIDTERLQLQEQNRFTAVELSTMMPVAGNAVYNYFIKANKWVAAYAPNKYYTLHAGSMEKQRPVLKKVAERIINLCIPTRVNCWLMKLTDGKWRKKWSKKNYPPEDYDLAFKTTLHVSKNHPANHQKRILACIRRFGI